MPRRVTVSVPAAIAAISSAPLRPLDSATASAAGATATVTCATASECVSS